MQKLFNKARKLVLMESLNKMKFHSPIWKNYSNVRDKLRIQFEPGFPFNELSGLVPEKLDAQLEEYASTHEDMPRILLRAHQLAFILEYAQIRVDTWDWFVNHARTGKYLFVQRRKWSDEARKDISVCKAEENGFGFPVLDLSHTTADWRRILALGYGGIAELAEQKVAAAIDEEAKNYYEAVSIVYRAAQNHIRRFAAEARRLGIIHIADSLEELAEHAPRTYHQALQLSLFSMCIQEYEGEYCRSQGTFDQLYYPFYKHDLDEGRLNREQAKELTCFYFDKFLAMNFEFNHNFCFGGKRPDGTDLCNPLTEICFECFEERKEIEPKIGFRIHKNTPKHLLDMMTKCVKDGCNSVVFANDDVAYDMFLRRGKELDDIVDFVPIGCYEPGIQGKELNCSMTAKFNIARIAELLFVDDWCPTSFEDVLQHAHDMVERLLKDTLDTAKKWEQAWPQVNPSPFLSGPMLSCLEKGRDISHSGTKYSSSGVVCMGLGTLADSLASIRYAVFDEKLCTWNEMKIALAKNWEGAEELQRQVKYKAPKWGNNLDYADDIAVAFASQCSNIINNTANSKGNSFQMGLWTINNNMILGAKTGATPDGRIKGEQLTKNLSPAAGADREGVTAAILSASKFDHAEFPDGSVLDLMLHPSVVSGENGHEIIENLIKAFFASGGLFIQFNVVNVEQLREAQRDPEHNRNLQVRVCGWNTRFVDLTRQVQDTFIKEAAAQE